MIPNSNRSKAPIKNHKYVSIEVVQRMISRLFPNTPFSPDDIREWSWEMLEKIGLFESFHLYTDHELKIENGIVKFPCGIYRVLSIRDKSGYRINDFINYGDTIELPKGSSGTILIDYLGIPVDKDGNMQIFHDARGACFWYCVQNLNFENYFNGKITENRWQEIRNKLNGSMAFAKQSMRIRTQDHNNRVQEANYLFTRTPRLNRELGYYGKGY